MPDLKIIVVQPDILWKNIPGNQKKISEMLDTADTDADLIVLPEMFQTGFCTQPADVAEPMDGSTVRWMKRTAEARNCAIAGSLVIKEGRRFYNRLVYIDQYENMSWYDKRHLFTIEGEESKYTPGLRHLVVPLKGWHISFLICYDLRFPVWARNAENYDVLVYSASWPESRDDVWSTLLRARAMENQSYVIGVNRTGTDGNKLNYVGNSIVVDPKGRVMAGMKDSHEGLLSVTLSKEPLDKFRKEFPAWKDADDFELKI
ncbi:MAG TPA: amidohydrolase [Bacteroidales bacterium]|nr:amidohydrolase [Bacteroidales bacterium]